MNWTHKGKLVTEGNVPEKAIGFIYCIYNNKVVDEETGNYYSKPYIGKKLLTTSRKTKIGKKAVAAERASRADGKAKTVKRVVKSSNWQQYNGSCLELIEDIKTYGEEQFTKHIIEWCYTKKYLGYCEMKHQILNRALEENTYNRNVLSRWFGRDIENEYKARENE